MAIIREDWQPKPAFDIQPQRVQTGAPQQPQSGGGFQPSALISEASGLGGAGLGALIGSLGGPIGSVIGAGIGGFIGGTGGSAAEQQYRDGQIDLGKALKEGTIEGIFSAGPLRLVRGAGKGFKLIRAADDFADAGKLLKSGGNQIDNVFSGTGKSLRATGRGIRTGVGSGPDQLRPLQADELNEFLTKRVKSGGGSAEKQLRKLEPFNEKLNKQLTEAIQESGFKFQPEDTENIANRVWQRVQDEVGLSPLQTQSGKFSKLGREFFEEIDNLSKLESSQNLDTMLKRIRNKVNFGRSPASKTPEAEGIFRIFQQELKEEVADKLPRTQAIKDELRKSIQAEKFLLNRAGKTGSGFSPGGATLPSSAAQTIQGRSGQALETLGRGLGATGPVAAGVRAGVGGALSPDGSGATPTTQASGGPIDQLTQSLGGPMTNDMTSGGELAGSQTGTQGGPTLERFRNAVLIDIQETGGENIDQIKMVAKLYGIDLDNPQTDSGQVNPRELPVGQQSQLIALEGIQDILTQIEQGYGTLDIPDNQLIAGLTSPVRKLQSAFDEDLRFYTQTLRPKAITLIRAAGEVGNLSKTEQDAAIDALPNVGDSPEVAARKLAQLREQFAKKKQNILNLGGTSGGGSAVDVQALMNALGVMQ